MHKQTYINNPNFNQAKDTKSEVDPLYEHIEGLRRTIGKIMSIQRTGEQALGETVTNKPRRRRENPRHATARVAEEFSLTKPPTDPEFIYSSFLAGVPSYAEAIDRLPENHEWSPLSYEERQTEVMKTIAFNDRIRTIIDANPRLSPDSLSTIVAGVIKHYKYDGGQSAKLNEYVAGSIRGMRHELAFESVLYYLPEGFEVINTTDKDDARGADFIVKAPNGRYVKIDVKASERKAMESMKRKEARMARHGKKPPINELILASGFTSADFRTDYPWRVKDEAIARVLPGILAQIMRGAGMTHAKHDSRR